MNTMNEQAIFDEIARNDQHFSQAPHAFFHAWKRGVELVGPVLFGNGNRESLDLAVEKWDLCPNVALIKKAVGAMSSGEKVFLAALVSFYNAVRPRLRWPVRATAAGRFLRRRLPAELSAAARLAVAPAGQPGRAPCLRLLRRLRADHRRPERAPE
jgi:hypothetical protein